MRISIVTPYAPPEKGANILRVESLRKFLEGKKCFVEVFAPARGGAKHSSVTRYPGVLNLMKLIIRSKSSVVIFTSPPLTHGFFSGVAALISGKSFYLDIRDPWPLAFQKINLYRKGTFKLQLFKLIELFTYTLAKKIFVVTKGIGKHVASKGFGRKVVLAPNGTIADFKFYPSARQIIRKKLGFKPRDVVLLYSGAFVGWDVDKVISSIAKMPQNYKLLFLTPDSGGQKGEFSSMKQYAQSVLGARVVVVDMASFGLHKVSEYFSAADVGISTVPKGLDYCIRAKVYDYAAVGLFSLAEGPSGGSLHKLFKEFYLGKYCASWGAFSRFNVKAELLSIASRKKRIDLARKNFMREETNKIILAEILKQ